MITTKEIWQFYYLLCHLGRGHWGSKGGRLTIRYIIFIGRLNGKYLSIAKNPEHKNNTTEKSREKQKDMNWKIPQQSRFHSNVRQYLCNVFQVLTNITPKRVGPLAKICKRAGSWDELCLKWAGNSIRRARDAHRRQAQDAAAQRYRTVPCDVWASQPALVFYSLRYRTVLLAGGCWKVVMGVILVGTMYYYIPVPASSQLLACIVSSSNVLYFHNWFHFTWEMITWKLESRKKCMTTIPIIFLSTLTVPDGSSFWFRNIRSCLH